jgi:peptidoglycan hydrolase-like protein with peptidoglycan-binding domain
MRITSLTVLLSLLLTMMGFAATAKRKAPVKKSSKSASKKVVHRRRASTTWRNRQLKPTAERYKEIQQALHEKGYLKSEPTGVWGDDSEDALERFQADQKLPANGKITAASLIGLGLGAKSAGAPEAPPLPGSPGAIAEGPSPPPAQPSSHPAAP